MAAPPHLERRIVSVVFADLVGFTTLAESLDAEDVASIQDAYFAGVRDAVARYSGRLEKFIGDAAVAAFGVDRTRDDDPQRAVRCGLALAAMVDALGGRLGLESGMLRLRVGVNTGEVAVAVGGIDEGRLSGDVINVAARLQAATEAGTVLCGEGTILGAAHAIVFDDPADLDLKGKTDVVRAAVARSTRPQASRDAAMGSLRASTIGRASELARFRAAIEDARGGATGRWMIIAAPGVGKSRLLHEIGLVAADLGCRVLTTRVHPDTGGSLEAAAADLIVAAVGDTTDPAATLARAGIGHQRVEVLLAELGSILSRSGAAPVNDAATSSVAAGSGADAPADERAARFAGWLELIDGLTAPRTQVWLVEDVHWATGDLLALLEAAGSAATPNGRLVVATARPSILDTLRSGAAGAGAVRLDLGPIATEAATDLVHELIGAALPTPLADRVVARADGNPLFIEELLRTWVSVGILVLEQDGWRLAVAPANVPLPATVQAIYAAQLDDLPDDARMIARHASVAGRRFAEGALESLGIAADGRVHGLETLGRRALIDGPADDPPLGPAYGFRHALLRDAGYASLARLDRAVLHVGLARWLERIAASGVALGAAIGTQYAAALDALPSLAPGLPGDLDRVALARLGARWLELAADEALETAAYAEAVAWLRASVASTPTDDAIDAARRTGRLGELVAASEGTDAAQALLDEARQRFAARLDGPDAVAARSGYAAMTATAARVAMEQLRFRDAFAMASDALVMLRGADEHTLAPLVLAEAQADAFESNRMGHALDAAERVRAVAVDAEDRALELDALRLRQIALGEEGLVDDQLDETVAELARSLGRWPLFVRVRMNQAVARTSMRVAEAQAMLEEAEEVALARGLLESQAWIAQTRADLAFGGGDWDEAIRQGVIALDIAEARGYIRAAVRTWFVLRPIAAYRGDRTLLARLRRWIEARSDLPDSPYGRLMHGAIDLDLAGADAAPLDPDRLRPAWGLAFDEPTVIAARDRVFEGWLGAGMSGEIRAALDSIADAQSTIPLAWASQRLWNVRLARAHHQSDMDVQADARAALRLAVQGGASWWVAQAIGELEALGLASRAELAQRDAIEARLRG